MNITWGSDAVLYIFVIMGIVLYSTSVKRNLETKYPNEVRYRSLSKWIIVCGFTCVTLMFCIGVLHQANRLPTRLAMICFVLLVVVGFSMLQYVRRALA